MDEARAPIITGCTTVNRLSDSQIRRIAISLLSTLILLAHNIHTLAADSEFVGVLALAVEEDVAKQLGISEPLRNKLLNLVDEREGDALELAMSLRDLPKEQRDAKLAPFRTTSERMGLALLTPDQRKGLYAIRIRKLGMMSLGEPKIAKQLQLTEEQKTAVADLLAKRKAISAKLSRAGAARAQRAIDGQIKAVLSPEQIVAWQGIASPQGTAKWAGNKPQAGKLAAGKAAGGTAASTSIASGDGKLQFSFRYAPWSTVIQWFAEQSELSLLMDAPPQGTFNYNDPRQYTPSQAIDLLNSVLLTKGYTLVRREQMLMVVNLEDGVPPNLITEVSIDKLDELGEYELAKCLFTLRGVEASEAAEEIGRLVGPQGKVNVLTSSNQLQITETAGRLRTFRKILEAGAAKSGAALGSATLIRLDYVRANNIIDAWRKLMGLAEEENVTTDGSLRVTKGKTSRQIIVSGEPHRVKEFEDLVALLDAPSGDGALNTPQLEVYAVTEADPASVLSVMQELFADVDEIRLATDPTTGSLVALATPEEHATIRATINQMQQDRREVEVIRLRSVDPQLAMLSIEKLFGPPEGSEEEAKPNTAPRVDADPTSRSLMIRGSAAQISDIRNLLSKMGEQLSDEPGEGGGYASQRGNVRMIPIDAATARRALDQLAPIWPNVRQNRIRTVTHSSLIRERRSRAGTEEKSIENRESTTESIEEPLKSTSTTGSSDSRYVANELAEPQTVTRTISDPQAGSSDQTLPDIIVTVGEQGLLIASEDTAALDAFEELFMTLADQLFTGTRELSIFYLKFAKANFAAEVIKQFIGGGSSSSSSGGTMLGSLASAALGNMGGGIMGSLLGGGSGGGTTSLSKGTTVLADPRLNALVVQATPKELDFIENLLVVLDKQGSPERVETIPRARAIPVYNTSADEVAEVVRNIYAGRLAGGSSGQRRQPSPEEFIRAMSGQKNTSRSIQDSIRDQVQINISVDRRRNALLVVAPDALFEEIQELVAELDFATPELAETVRYGRASGSSPEIIREAIASLLPDTIEDESTGSKTNKQNRKKDSTPVAGQQPGPNRMEEMKRGMEFMKAMQNRAAKERAASAARKKKAVAGGKK